jgi:uncharacterized surface protein with fasciclin (FAS1) repeats
LWLETRVLNFLKKDAFSFSISFNRFYYKHSNTMTTLKNFLFFFILGVFALTACKDKAAEEKKAQEKATADSLAKVRAEDSIKQLQAVEENKNLKNIADLLEGTGKSLVESAQLLDSLKSGSFTVFLPSDEALTAAKAQIDKLAAAKDKKDLQKLLQYHIVKGVYKADELRDGQELETVSGSKLKISIKEGKMTLNDAEVNGETSNVLASNGVIHRISKVMMPK